MKQVIIFFSLACVLLACSASPTGIDEAYVEALEALLEEKDLEYDIDYISLFINDSSISERSIEIIQSYFEQTYEKIVFTYTPDEVTHAGPYGKENLAMDGMFLYVLDIDQVQDTLTIETAKFHTVHERGALGLEVIFKEGEHGWVLQAESVLWRE